MCRPSAGHCLRHSPPSPCRLPSRASPETAPRPAPSFPGGLPSSGRPSAPAAGKKLEADLADLKNRLKMQELETRKVQEFFDNLSEKYVHAEPLLIQDTSQVELDYIAARAAEAELAKEAGSAGHVGDEAEAAAEEKELVGWEESTGEASSTDNGAPLIEDVVDESTEEEAEADDPPALEKKRVLRRASSGPSSADQEDIDTVIGEVARDAEAEAEKIAAEEAAKTAAEDAAKGPNEEAGMASTRTPVEGEVFDDEVLAAAGLEAKSKMAPVDKAEADLTGRVSETQAWFRQAHEELKVAQDLLAE
nr:uncharacterized protein CG45076-like [Aegilops tauschii subsp. strangulata]